MFHICISVVFSVFYENWFRSIIDLFLKNSYIKQFERQSQKKLNFGQLKLIFKNDQTIVK